MKKFIILVVAMYSAIALYAQSEYVNPIIGTEGMDHTFPEACVPFGAVQLSPDT